MDEQTPQTKKTARAAGIPARMGQLKTLKNDNVTVTVVTDASQLSKLLKLITACQAGNSLLLSAEIVKPKPVKKDAKEKPNPQKQKGPRRVRRYPYR